MYLHGKVLHCVHMEGVRESDWPSGYPYELALGQASGTVVKSVGMPGLEAWLCAALQLPAAMQEVQVLGSLHPYEKPNPSSTTSALTWSNRWVSALAHSLSFSYFQIK